MHCSPPMRPQAVARRMAVYAPHHPNARCLCSGDDRKRMLRCTAGRTNNVTQRHGRRHVGSLLLHSCSVDLQDGAVDVSRVSRWGAFRRSRYDRVERKPRFPRYPFNALKTAFVAHCIRSCGGRGALPWSSKQGLVTGPQWNGGVRSGKTGING